MLKSVNKRLTFYLPLLVHLLYVVLLDRSLQHFALTTFEFSVLAVSKLISGSANSPALLLNTFLFLHQIFFWGVPNAYNNLTEAQPSAARAFLLSVLFIPPLTGASWRLCHKILDRTVPERSSATATKHVSAERIFYLIIFLLGLAFAILIAYVVQIRSSLAFWGMLSGFRYEELAVLRKESLSSLTPSILPILVQYSRDFLLPICVILSIFLCISRRHRIDYIVFVMSFALAFFAAVANLEKSPMLNLGVLTVFAVGFLHGNIPKRIIVVSTIGAGSLLLFFVRVSNAADRTLMNLLEGIFRRTVLAPAEIAGQYFLWAPTYSEGFLYGAGLPFFHNFSARGTVDVASEIYTFTRPNDVIQGSANGAFFSMAWVEVGWTSLILSILLVGMVLAVYDHFTARYFSKPTSAALLALTIIAVIKLYSTSITSSLLGVGFSLIDVTLLLALFDLLSRRAFKDRDQLPYG